MIPVNTRKWCSRSAPAWLKLPQERFDFPVLVVEAKVATRSVARHWRAWVSVRAVNFCFCAIKKQKSEMPDDGSETFNCHVLPGTERRAQVRETQMIDAHNQEVLYQ
ncbi:hypothetical protein P0D88_47960 [Paraburkholderia sp. RL18-103-BIB-C]|uniref:hypothetical protein n=1 Tax=unclassified Paraburkholderia TaxID=2615204 RepID=UPI0038BA89D4